MQTVFICGFDIRVSVNIFLARMAWDVCVCVLNLMYAFILLKTFSKKDLLNPFVWYVLRLWGISWWSSD